MRILLIALALGVGLSSPARAWDPFQHARRAAAEGQRALAEGDSAAAIQHFLNAQALDPESDELRMGLGEALYRTGDFESAVRQYDSVGRDKDGPWHAPALYDAGNAAFDAGDLEQAMDYYTRALLEAEGAPSDDLLHNLELTQLLLEKQQQQQQQSGDDQNQDQQQQDGQDGQDQQQQGDQQQDQNQGQQQQDQQQQDQQQQDQQQQDQQQDQQDQQDQQQQDAQDARDANDKSGDPQAADQNPQSQMTPEQAMRLLQALDADEAELRKSIQRRLRGNEKEAEHDW